MNNHNLVCRVQSKDPGPSWSLKVFVYDNPKLRNPKGTSKPDCICIVSYLFGLVQMQGGLAHRKSFVLDFAVTQHHFDKLVAEGI